MRPSRPRSDQAIRDAALPVRNGSAGGRLSGGITASSARADVSAVRMKPLNNTPLASDHSSTPPMISPSRCAAPMYVMHIALGGCIKQPPISYGLTQDTGGHISYILGAATAQSHLPEVTRVDILTRLFDDPVLGADHREPVQQIGPRLRILRLKGPSSANLTREALDAGLPALTEAFLDLLAHLPKRPDILHCHFADAAELGLAARARFRLTRNIDAKRYATRVYYSRII